MRIDLDAWLRRRAHTLKGLREHLAAGRVDEDIIGLLEAINSLPYAFSTSSCSGRIQLYEANEPGEKFELRTVSKWHTPISVDQLMTVMGSFRNLWLAVLPPILHICVCNLAAAEHLLKTLRDSGFKRAGIISISHDGITIETMGTERIEMPLRLDGKDIIRREAIPLIVERANSLLIRSKVRLSKLEEVLKDEVAGGMDNLCR